MLLWAIIILVLIALAIFFYKRNRASIIAKYIAKGIEQGCTLAVILMDDSHDRFKVVYDYDKNIRMGTILNQAQFTSIKGRICLLITNDLMEAHLVTDKDS
jgi:hypothetical protein